MAQHAGFTGTQQAYADARAGETAVIALATAAASLVLISIYRLFFHPLAHIPGPFIARLTGLWRDAGYRRGQWHDEILAIHDKYGRVVRIAPNEVSIVDERAMKQLYSHGHNATKTSWYSVWDYPQKDQLFTAQDKNMHAFLRKRISGAYSMSSILKYEEFIQECLDILLAKLHKYADKGPVNMSNWTNAFAFDVIGELAYGTRLGMLETETDVKDIRKNIFSAFKFVSTMGHFPGQLWIVTNAVVSQVLPIPVVHLQKWIVEQVQNRLDHIHEVKREDMLQHFCRMQNERGEPVQRDEIVTEALNLIGAGADTTSIAMRTCLFYVASDPDCYHRLQKEVDTVYEDDLPGNTPLTYLRAQKMPYLQAVIKEATRLLPSIVFQLLRNTPPNFIVRGYHIPEGTTVGISPIAQNHDKEIWGVDADDFRPDRWLEDEQKAKMFDTASMTFGGNGPRMCIGRNIALVEVHKFLGQFVRNFDFEITNKDRPWKITTYWFAYQHDLMMDIRPRKHAS